MPAATTRHEQTAAGHWMTLVTIGLATVVLAGWVHSRDAVPIAMALLQG